MYKNEEILRSKTGDKKLSPRSYKKTLKHTFSLTIHMNLETSTSRAATCAFVYRPVWNLSVLSSVHGTYCKQYLTFMRIIFILRKRRKLEPWLTFLYILLLFMLYCLLLIFICDAGEFSFLERLCARYNLACNRIAFVGWICYFVFVFVRNVGAELSFACMQTEAKCEAMFRCQLCGKLHFQFPINRTAGKQSRRRVAPQRDRLRSVYPAIKFNYSIERALMRHWFVYCRRIGRRVSYGFNCCVSRRIFSMPACMHTNLRLLSPYFISPPAINYCVTFSHNAIKIISVVVWCVAVAFRIWLLSGGRCRWRSSTVETKSGTDQNL